jgi:hypothetical protein
MYAASLWRRLFVLPHITGEIKAFIEAFIKNIAATGCLINLPVSVFPLLMRI